MSLRVSSLSERLNSRLVIDANGCWNFTGTRGFGGYGHISVNNRPVGAHRVSWELTNGPIPDGLQIDHLCRNRACCNPSHLELVTPAENTRRGQGPAAINQRKTECLRGHAFDLANTYVSRTGRRHCRTCRTAFKAARRAEARAAA